MPFFSKTGLKKKIKNGFKKNGWAEQNKKKKSFFTTLPQQGDDCVSQAIFHFCLPLCSFGHPSRVNCENGATTENQGVGALFIGYEVYVG